jgi:hypothetical protein
MHGKTAKLLDFIRRKYPVLLIAFCGCLSCLPAYCRTMPAISSCSLKGRYVILKMPADLTIPTAGFHHGRPGLSGTISPLFSDTIPPGGAGLSKGLFRPQPYTAALACRDRHALGPLSIAVPATALAYGVIALHESAFRTLNLSAAHEIAEDHPDFHTHFDNYLQLSPAAAVVALNLAGVRGQHDFTDELCIYVVSSVIMGATVWSLKTITHEQRPDHSSFNSFPSGHTATAFAAAEWLRTEYSRSPWIGAAGYAAATATGILRVYNNRHWVSDVISGAAFGFLSTRIAYVINPWLERHIVELTEGGHKHHAPPPE